MVPHDFFAFEGYKLLFLGFKRLLWKIRRGHPVTHPNHHLMPPTHRLPIEPSIDDHLLNRLRLQCGLLG